MATAATGKFWSGLTLAAALAALAPPSSSAQLLTPPDRDNTLFEPAPQVLGCTASTSNGAGQYIFSGLTNIGAERRALLHFDLSSIPPGSTVTEATLTLNLNRVAGGSQPTDQFGLRRLTADWGEGTSDGGSEEGNGGPATAGDATWCDRFFQVTPWSSIGGDFASPASATIAVGTEDAGAARLGPDRRDGGGRPGLGGFAGDELRLGPDPGFRAVPTGRWTGGGRSKRRPVHSREGDASISSSLVGNLRSHSGPPVVEVPTLSSWGLALLVVPSLLVALRFSENVRDSTLSLTL